MSDLEIVNILSLPTEVLLYILQFLSEARDKVKLLYVSRRLRSISETPSLWREFVWPQYSQREKKCLHSTLRNCGEHVERLSLLKHVMLSRPVNLDAVKEIREETPGLVSMLRFCNNLKYLRLSAGPDLILEQLREVVQNMKSLEVLDIYLPHRGLSSERFVVHTDNTFQVLFNLSAKLKELTIRLEISIKLRMKDLQNWVSEGFKPTKLNIVPVEQSFLQNDLLCAWDQWNSQVPVGHTACLRLYHYSKVPLNIFPDLPVFQLRYGETATLPFMRAGSLGLLGLNKDLLLLTDCTYGSSVIYKAKIDQTLYSAHNIVCSDNHLDTFSLVSELDLSKCDLQPGHLNKIAISCPNLQRLNLRINQDCLSLEGIEMIARCCCNLRGLNLSGIPVNDVQCRVKIWKVLVTMKLTHLTMSILFLTRPQTDSDIYKKQLSSLFEQCTTLQALELYCNCHTTRRDYELLCCFPLLKYCKLNLVQYSKCLQDILTTCENLTCFCCHCITELSLASVFSNNLQQLYIISLDTDVDDNFIDTVSSHRKLIHVFFKVHSVTGKGIATIIKNSPDLLTFIVHAQELKSFNFRSDVNLLMKEFSARKLFNFGTLNLLPLDVAPPDYLMRNTDLTPLWP